jgi:hypothetical protein
MEINAGRADSSPKARLTALSNPPMPMWVTGFRKFIADETEK